MSQWQNLSVGFFDGVGKYQLPRIDPVYELPEVDRFIEFDYCKRVRTDKNKLGVHFFEDDRKFERVWTGPDRYGEMLKQFAFVIGPDFSVYEDFPFPVRLYNYYRNNWLVRYWQSCYNIIVVPTVMWGDKSTYDWCFDGLPRKSIVAVSNLGMCKRADEKQYFEDGYLEMLNRLEPSEILFFSRNFAKFPGNIRYIRWEIHKGDQIYG